jgi:hypothetical protein
VLFLSGTLQADKTGGPKTGPPVTCLRCLAGRQGFGYVKLPRMKILVPVKELSTYRARAPVPLECENCGITFYKPKCDVLTSLKGNPQFALRFCSLKCHHAKRVKDTHIEVACEQCGKLVIKQTSWLKKNKHNFCSRSCSAKFQNAHKTLGKSRKSKAETYLGDLIRADFKQLLVEENVRGMLPSGLELDLYVPALKLAIELNGPLHFFPIYGKSKLQSIKDKDIQKAVEAQSIGCNLIIIDISRIKYWPETQAFLDEEYKNKIKPLIKMMKAGK